MDKDFVYTYYQNNHYFKSGILALIALLSFLVFLPIGEARFIFLVCLLAIPILIFEFINYYSIMAEIRRDKFITKKMRLGRMSLIIMKNERVGIQFEGLADSKPLILKYYILERRHESIMKNLSRYEYIEFDYYDKSKVVKDFRSIQGDTNGVN